MDSNCERSEPLIPPTSVPGFLVPWGSRTMRKPSRLACSMKFKVQVNVVHVLISNVNKTVLVV